MTLRHFLDVDDLTPDELADVLGRSGEAAAPHVLAGRGVALLFEKPSARTRNSSEMAVVQLGGHPVTIRGDEVGFDVRETVEDITRTLACYHAAIGARVVQHSVLERMAAVSSVPVINLLSDAAHPCQVLADLLTLKQEFGTLTGRRLAWVGDANNVCRSLLAGAARCGMDVAVAAPDGYGLTDDAVAHAHASGIDVTTTTKPEQAVEGADAVVTDVWASMGQEAEAEARKAKFRGFQISRALMKHAKPDCVVLHCLPAHYGEEIEYEASRTPNSAIFDEAENRMHAQNALMLMLMGL